MKGPPHTDTWTKKPPEKPPRNQQTEYSAGGRGQNPGAVASRHAKRIGGGGGPSPKNTEGRAKARAPGATPNQRFPTRFWPSRENKEKTKPRPPTKEPRRIRRIDLSGEPRRILPFRGRARHCQW